MSDGTKDAPLSRQGTLKARVRTLRLDLEHLHCLADSLPADQCHKAQQAIDRMHQILLEWSDRAVDAGLP